MKLWTNWKNVLLRNLSIDNLVRIYENALDDEWCNRIRTKFDEHPNQEEHHSEGNMSFRQIKIQNFPQWGEELKYLFMKFNGYRIEYKKDVLLEDTQWPEKYSWEEFRIKKYLPNGVDQFDFHVDVKSYENARRFLVMFAYLDDNEKGSTELRLKSEYDGPDYEEYRRNSWVNSPCQKGSILIFPPLWPWFHAGMMPKSSSKYIVGSYLHYVEAEV